MIGNHLHCAQKPVFAITMLTRCRFGSQSAIRDGAKPDC